MKRLPQDLVSNLAFILMLLSSCSNSMDEVAMYTEDDGAIEISKNVELLYSDSGQVQFMLESPLLERYVTGKDSSYTEFKEGLHVEFYDSQKEIESELTCNYAIDLAYQNKVIAKDDVLVVNRYGEELRTEHLWWLRNSEMIYSDKFVKIKTKDETIYGDGLEANQDFTKYKILNIKGIIKHKQDQDEDL
ncbi:MAG: LPS export ABC transporter periplasmic protein LptC [Flavobacteriales bacterium]|nr:LPS export ABC transporter periplasmic protein LptC [Flavobacteriales bacterium]